MPIYYGSTKIDRVNFGGTEISKMYYGGTLVFQRGAGYVFPYPEDFPGTVSETVLDSVSGQNYKIGIIPEDGWYRIATRAESGSGQWSSGRNATGGCVSDAIVYLYKGSKYIIWGASGRMTGYIAPSGNATSPLWKSNADATGVLGGCGASGGYSGESGGGGGGAGGHGTWRHSDAGYGGGGTGCIVGLEHDGNTLTEEWNHGGFGVKSVEAMVLAGGGGSNAGDNDEPRTGGSGGGAWGNGGTSQYNGAYGVGPGGETFGKGESNNGWGYWAGPARGAWAVRDYTKGRFDCGVGIKADNSCGIGETYIYRIQVPYATLTLKPVPNSTKSKFMTAVSCVIDGRSITVPINSYVRWYTGRQGYYPRVETEFLTENTTKTVILEKATFSPMLDLRYTYEDVEDYYDEGSVTDEVESTLDLGSIMKEQNT